MEEQTNGVAEEVTQVVENNSNDELKNIISSAENIENYEQPQSEIKKEIRYGELVSLGWEMFKNNAKILLLFMLTYLGVRILEGILQKAAEKASFLTLVLGILFFVLNILIGIGWLQVFLKISRGQAAEIKEIIGNGKYFWRFLGGSILYGLIVLGGLILLIVPGIIWAYKYSLFSYFIIDKDMGVMQSLKASGEAMLGFKWKLFLLQLLMFAIVLLGLICLGVGVFVSAIVVTLMTVNFYRILIGEKVYA